MFDNVVKVISNVIVATANMGANTMSTYFAYEPEMPECLAETEEEQETKNSFIVNKGILFCIFFDVYVEPYEDVKQIKIHAKAPSGQIYTELYNGTEYTIFAEVGVWYIYATLENDAGVYEATDTNDFVTFEIVPLDIGLLLPYTKLPLAKQENNIEDEKCEHKRKTGCTHKRIRK